MSQPCEKAAICLSCQGAGNKLKHLAGGKVAVDECPTCGGTGTQSMTLSTRLAEVRQDKRMSYRALAQRCGIPVATLNRWERGLQSPTLDHIGRIAVAFDMTVLEFLKPLYTDRDEHGGGISDPDLLLYRSKWK